MHNLNIDNLLQQLITTTGILDEDANYLDHIDEHNFFNLTDNNRLLVSIWYLITLLTEHSIDTTVTNLNDVNVNLNSNKLIVDNLSTLKDLLLTVQLKDNEVKLADNTVKLANNEVKLNSLPEATLSTKTLTDLINILTTTVTNTKVTNDVNLSDITVNKLNTVKVNNLVELINATLTTKLTEDTITAIVTKLANTEFKLSISTLTELVNKLLSTVLTVKVDNKLTTDIANFNDLITKLTATTLNTNTNFASLIASVLTVKLNNIDELVTKLNNLTVQTTNAIKSVVLTDNVINSIEVTNYSNATYQLTITGLMGSFSINILGSLDNTNWFTLPLMTSSLNINNNAVLVSSNSTVMLNVNCNCKYIKLNTVSLPLLTRIDAKLYLK